jgi:hypothetical protein
MRARSPTGAVPERPDACRSGRSIPAVEAHRIIKVLRAEWQTKAALARDLGRHHDLARLSQQDMITVRMLLRIRYLYRVRMLEPRADPETSPRARSRYSARVRN